MKHAVAVAFFFSCLSSCSCREYCDYSCELEKYILPVDESCKWTRGRNKNEVEAKFGIDLDIDYGVSNDGKTQYYVNQRPWECYYLWDGAILSRCGDGGFRDSSSGDLSPIDGGKCLFDEPEFCEKCTYPDVCYAVRLWFLDVPQGAYFDCQNNDCFYDTEPGETCKLVRGCRLLVDAQTGIVSAADVSCFLCVPTRYSLSVPIEMPIPGRPRDIDCSGVQP